MKSNKNTPAVGRGFGWCGGEFCGCGPDGLPSRTFFTFTVPSHSYVAFTVKKVYVFYNTMN